APHHDVLAVPIDIEGPGGLRYFDPVVSHDGSFRFRNLPGRTLYGLCPFPTVPEVVSRRSYRSRKDQCGGVQARPINRIRSEGTLSLPVLSGLALPGRYRVE